MKRKKAILLVIAGLAVLALAFLLLFSASGPPTQVVGELSAQDVAEIKSVVGHKLWHDAFPDFSWQSIKGLPRGAYHAVELRLQITNYKESDTETPISHAFVAVLDETYPAAGFLMVKENTGHWKCEPQPRPPCQD